MTDILLGGNPKLEFEEESRWSLAEQKFLEVFFGKDIILRTRQRRKHLQLRSKEVSFNLNGNIKYDFKPFPEKVLGSKTKVDDGDVTSLDQMATQLSKRKMNERIVRPKTAELTASQKKRLKDFRELDTIAFIKPTKSHSQSNDAQSIQFNGELWRTPSSHAGKIILARMTSSSQYRDISPQFSAKSKIYSDFQTSSRNSSARDISSGRKTISNYFDSTHNMNPISKVTSQVDIAAGGFVIPKRRRPIEKNMRKVLAETIHYAIHPKLGFHSEKDSSIKSGYRYYKKYEHHDPEKPISLHDHLHPRPEPKPGLSQKIHLFEGESKFGDAKSELRLQIPNQLVSSLHDPQNLKNLQGNQIGGKVSMKNIFRMYQNPKVPKRGGRITPPFVQPNNSQETRIIDIDDLNEFPIGVPTPIPGFFGIPNISKSVDETDKCTYDINTDALKTVSDIEHIFAPAAENDMVKTMERCGSVFDDIDYESDEEFLTLDSPLQHSNHSVENIMKHVVHIFPLDYFMDQEELHQLENEFSNTEQTINIPCKAIARKRKYDKNSKHVNEQLWKDATILAYNPTVRQFLVKWSSERIPTKISHRKLPPPSASMAWLSRAEIVCLDRETFEKHIQSIIHAKELRHEFETEAMISQVSGIVAAQLMKVLPSFPENVTEMIYQQCDYTVARLKNTSTEISSSTLILDSQKKMSDQQEFQVTKDIDIAQFLPLFLNSIREDYFLSQTKCMVKFALGKSESRKRSDHMEIQTKTRFDIKKTSKLIENKLNLSKDTRKYLGQIAYSAHLIHVSSLKEIFSDISSGRIQLKKQKSTLETEALKLLPELFAKSSGKSKSNIQSAKTPSKSRKYKSSSNKKIVSEVEIKDHLLNQILASLDPFINVQTHRWIGGKEWQSVTLDEYLDILTLHLDSILDICSNQVANIVKNDHILSNTDASSSTQQLKIPTVENFQSLFSTSHLAIPIESRVKDAIKSLRDAYIRIRTELNFKIQNGSNKIMNVAPSVTLGLSPSPSQIETSLKSHFKRWTKDLLSAANIRAIHDTEFENNNVNFKLYHDWIEDVINDQINGLDAFLLDRQTLVDSWSTEINALFKLWDDHTQEINVTIPDIFTYAKELWQLTETISMRWSSLIRGLNGWELRGSFCIGVEQAGAGGGLDGWISKIRESVQQRIITLVDTMITMTTREDEIDKIWMKKNLLEGINAIEEFQCDVDGAFWTNVIQSFASL